MHICTGTVDDGVSSQKQELMFRMDVVAAASVQDVSYVVGVASILYIHKLRSDC